MFATHKTPHHLRHHFTLLCTLLMLSSMITLTGCNDAQAGSLLGAGVGALAGQAIGGDTGSTLIGAGVGAGAGYIIGNEMDKERAQRPNCL